MREFVNGWVRMRICIVRLWMRNSEVWGSVVEVAVRLRVLAAGWRKEKGGERGGRRRGGTTPGWSNRMVGEICPWRLAVSLSAPPSFSDALSHSHSLTLLSSSFLRSLFHSLRFSPTLPSPSAFLGRVRPPKISTLLVILSYLRKGATRWGKRRKNRGRTPPATLRNSPFPLDTRWP